MPSRQPIGPTAEKAEKTARAPAAHRQRGGQALHPVVSLQRTAGNRATAALVQAKLRVGSTGDSFEQEAEALSERAAHALQWRRGAAAGAEDPSTPPPPVTPLPHDARNGVPPFVTHALRSGGRPLEPGLRSSLEGVLGRDLRAVRIHTSTAASHAARRLRARAFTAGHDIAFGGGRFSPASAEGRRLLAHELTHVMQQSGGAPTVQRSATDPVDPVLPTITLTAGVGEGRPNNIDDVVLVQDRLHALGYLTDAGHAAETPAAGATGTIPEANLTETIAAIRAFQAEVMGMAAPDGAVDAGAGASLRHLNRAVPRPTAAASAAVEAARTGITQTTVRGVTITAPVGEVSNADVIAGNGNRPADVRAVQVRLVQLRHLAADHGETPTIAPVAVPIVLGEGVGSGRPNLAADVRPIQARVATLGHLEAADLAAEAPAAGATGALPEADLTATIAAIEAFQRACGLGVDGAVDVGGTTLGFLNTDSVPSGALPRTKQAIARFQDREVDFWRARPEISGTRTARRVAPGDATASLLDQISSYRIEFPGGEEIRFRDFVRSGYTRHAGGTSVGGIARPSALPEAEYTTVGLTPEQTAALRYVSAHEGNFDALNTYDVARVSFGFIQFAGGRGLPPFMALLKSREPATFARLFQTYGIDVEFDVSGGAISNAEVVVLDPATNTLLRGVPAEEAIRDSQRLSAIFMRAGRDVAVQRIQIQAATRDYVLPALGRSTSIEADIVEVLAAPGGAVTATHVGAAAVTFRGTTAYRDLNAAGRIRERSETTSAAMETILSSEQGLGVLMDRAIQEGVGGGHGRLRDAVRWVAHEQGVVDIAAMGGHEARILQQVVDDLTADIEIGTILSRARGHIVALRRAANATGATVAGVLARADADSARTEVDAAITALPRKSPSAARNYLDGVLRTERDRLDFAPPPATVAALRTLLDSIRRALELNNAAQRRISNAPAFRRRVQGVLGSTLAAP